jgi:hypothetical protein
MLHYRQPLKVKSMLKIFNLQSFEQITKIIQSIVTVVAIIYGGIWFIKSREDKPRVEVINNIETQILDEKSTLVFMNMSLKNVSHVLVEIDRVRLSLDQIIPIEDEKISTRISNDLPFEVNNPEWHWPPLYKYEVEESMTLEPDETNNIVVEFVIPRKVTVFQVYTFVHNAYYSSPAFGWPNMSIHRLEEEGSCGLGCAAK